MSVRLLSPSSGQWSTYWISDTTVDLSDPVRGTFADGIGTFCSDADSVDGTICHVLWTNIDGPHPHWKESRSDNGGTTWATAWTMDFSRPWGQERPRPDPPVVSPAVPDRYAAFSSLDFDRPGDGVLRLTLRTPGKLNAVGSEMHGQLAAVWPAVSADPDTRAVIVRGADGAFSAGGDLDLVAAIASDFDTRIRVFNEARDLVYNIVNCTKPIVSEISGPCVGAGLAVALLADISIAAPSARIIDGHTRLGVAAGDHSVIIWPLLCGLAKAKYHLLLCEPLDGTEAERIGLVSLCVPEDELEAKVLAVAERLAAGSAVALAQTKLALNNWLRSAGPAFDASLALEFLAMTGPDVQEGIASVRERRAPNFRG